jgi:hypothetical protein
VNRNKKPLSEMTPEEREAELKRRRARERRHRFGTFINRIFGIILATGIHLMIGSILPDTGMDFRALLLTIVLSAALVISRRMTKKGIQPIALIAISAVLGIVLYGI